MKYPRRLPVFYVVLTLTLFSTGCLDETVCGTGYILAGFTACCMDSDGNGECDEINMDEPIHIYQTSSTLSPATSSTTLPQTSTTTSTTSLNKLLNDTPISFGTINTSHNPLYAGIAKSISGDNISLDMGALAQGIFDESGHILKNAFVYSFTIPVKFNEELRDVRLTIKCTEDVDGALTDFVSLYAIHPYLNRYVSKNRFVNVSAYLAVRNTSLEGARIPVVYEGSEADAVIHLLFNDEWVYAKDEYGRIIPRTRGPIKCSLNLSNADERTSSSTGFALTMIEGCNDTVKAVSEEGVDCGGPCPACECFKDSDCGVNSYSTIRFCHEEEKKPVVARNYTSYTCTLNKCYNENITKILERCAADEYCKYSTCRSNT